VKDAPVEELVRRARAGERAASEALFRRFGPAALRCALAVTGGRRADAEDLVQDTFIRCLTHLDDLRQPTQFGGWLLRSLRNLAINRYHSGKAQQRAYDAWVLRDEMAAAPDDPFEKVAGAQRQVLVRTVFDRLPDGPLKETAQLYYVDGVEPTDAVAEKLGVPKSTVTTRLDRFRALLRKEILVHLARNTRPDAAREDAREALS